MNWTYVNSLLDVIEGTRQLPELKKLHDMAMGELREIAERGLNYFQPVPSDEPAEPVERRL